MTLAHTLPQSDSSQNNVPSAPSQPVQLPYDIVKGFSAYDVIRRLLGVALHQGTTRWPLSGHLGDACGLCSDPLVGLALPSNCLLLVLRQQSPAFPHLPVFLGLPEPTACCLPQYSADSLSALLQNAAVFEFEKLKHIFSMVIFYLEEKGTTNVPYHQAIPGAVEEVKKEVEKLKPVVPCIPPCGVQETARFFRCDSCRIFDCQLPIDCPPTTVDKAEGDGTLLKCEVKFALPPETTVKWRFAKDIHTQHLFLFKDLYFGTSSSLLIRPTLGSHHGTYTCQIQEENDVLVRKFFYLNVTTKRLGREKDLQKMFRDILHPPPGLAPEEVVPENKLPQLPTLQEMVSQPNYLRKKNVILLIVGLALSSMLLTMMALTIYHWATHTGHS